MQVYNILFICFLFSSLSATAILFIKTFLSAVEKKKKLMMVNPVISAFKIAALEFQ
jgi:hypothetical protein